MRSRLFLLATIVGLVALCLLMIWWSPQADAQQLGYDPVTQTRSFLPPKVTLEQVCETKIERGSEVGSTLTRTRCWDGAGSWKRPADEFQ